jgi:hypothetical protein
LHVRVLQASRVDLGELFDTGLRGRRQRILLTGRLDQRARGERDPPITAAELDRRQEHVTPNPFQRGAELRRSHRR